MQLWEPLYENLVAAMNYFSYLFARDDLTRRCVQSPAPDDSPSPGGEGRGEGELFPTESFRLSV